MIANRRQAMGQAQHDAANAFVKKQQNELKSIGGKSPDLKAEAMEFNAYMCNNGMHAQKFAKELTKGIDEKAFPVK